MKESTAAPAFTKSMTLRGRFNLSAMSLERFLSKIYYSVLGPSYQTCKRGTSRDVAPTTLVPLAPVSKNSFTLSTVLLKATTLNPWSFIFSMKFWPMTASPMSAMSPTGSLIFKNQKRIFPQMSN